MALLAHLKDGLFSKKKIKDFSFGEGKFVNPRTHFKFDDSGRVWLLVDSDDYSGVYEPPYTVLVERVRDSHLVRTGTYSYDRHFFQIARSEGKIGVKGTQELLEDKKYFCLEADLLEEEEKTLNNSEVKTETHYKKPKVSGTDVINMYSKVILDEELKEQIVESLSIEEIVHGQKLEGSGVILIGPPGTGKSVLMEITEEFFEKIGGHVKKKKLGDITSYKNDSAQAVQRWYVGGSVPGADGRNAYEPGCEEIALKNSVPSLLIVDEAKELIKKPGFSQTTQDFSDALEMFKAHIGNKDVQNVITMMAANIEASEVDDALTRDLRLDLYYIGKLDEGQLASLWKIKIKASDIVVESDFSEEQYLELARLIEPVPSNGAFMTNFCKKFYKLLSDTTTMERLVRNERLPRGYSVNFETFKYALEKAIRLKNSRT
ncbi:AAA family ATPase [Candidatus Woesearchaeota archaeon]|nr:AAA family ATPase [Nanoarchaeota archaeon]MCB9370486.1 AAA family ATPase [Candidatus Woesearchaeota archaeon]USN43564.1 MAG: AAA family ATPase [Candidatus Woesearchaeota archaeon]